MTRESVTTSSARRLEAAGSYLVATAIAFAIAGAFIGLMGYPVLEAYRTMATTSFRSGPAFYNTLVHYVPLLLLSLAFSVPLTTLRYNIGGEGQLLVGAAGAAALGIVMPDLPPVVLVPLLLVGGVVLGAFWAAVAAVLSDRFGISEVLTTVLLNFVAVQVLIYVAGQVWPDPVGGHALATLPISQSAELPTLISRPLHMGLLVAVAVAIVVIVYIRATPAGYEFRATGANQRAAGVFGIPVRKVAIGGLAIGGALAGLAGAIEVAGVHGAMVEGMQASYMMLGIVVGLIARRNVMAVPLIAFGVAVLEVGTSATQRTMGLPGEMVLIVTALILLFILLADVVRPRLRRVTWTST